MFYRMETTQNNYFCIKRKIKTEIIIKELELLIIIIKAIDVIKLVCLNIPILFAINFIIYCIFKNPRSRI